MTLEEKLDKLNVLIKNLIQSEKNRMNQECPTLYQ